MYRRLPAGVLQKGTPPRWRRYQKNHALPAEANLRNALEWVVRPALLTYFAEVTIPGDSSVYLMAVGEYWLKRGGQSFIRAFSGTAVDPHFPSPYESRDLLLECGGLTPLCISVVPAPTCRAIAPAQAD